MDEQGVEAIWLFPTLGVLYEEKLTHDTEALCTLFSAFNRWLEEDWGLSRGRIFAAPYISLADVKWACSELEWALERAARIIVMRPAAAWTADGPRAPGSTCFDPFWARAAEAGITVVIHTGNSGYSTNGYDEGGFGLASVGMDQCPSVAGLVLERAANDFLLDLAYKNVFERFPNLRIASIENGSTLSAPMAVPSKRGKRSAAVGAPSSAFLDEPNSATTRADGWLARIARSSAPA
jgi:hypothetical protein